MNDVETEEKNITLRYWSQESDKSQTNQKPGVRVSNSEAGTVAPKQEAALRLRLIIMMIRTGPQMENNLRENVSKKVCTRRAGKLYRARSRLHRSRFLQVNTRWTALAEIYTMHSFAPLWNPLAKNGEKRAWPKQPRKGGK